MDTTQTTKTLTIGRREFSVTQHTKTMNTTQATEKTPGFNRRMEICFGTDKNGRPIAYYFSKSYLCNWRRIRMNYVAAKLFVAQGQADEIPNAMVF